MSTVSAAAGALSAQSIWNRFLTSLDRDNNGTLSVDELAAMTSSEKAEKAIGAHDANGDGSLGADELPKEAFGSVDPGTLLNAQEYRNASPNERRADDKAAVDAMFARADTDGNGVLSKDEMDAERALNMASFTDTGELPQVLFMTRQGADANALKPEDFMVGRALSQLTPIADEDMPEELREQIEAMKALAEQHASETGTEPDAAPELTPAERVEATPMTSTFLARLIMSLGEHIAPEPIDA